MTHLPFKQFTQYSLGIYIAIFCLLTLISFLSFHNSLYLASPAITMVVQANGPHWILSMMTLMAILYGIYAIASLCVLWSRFTEGAYWIIDVLHPSLVISLYFVVGYLIMIGITSFLPTQMAPDLIQIHLTIDPLFIFIGIILGEVVIVFILKRYAPVTSFWFQGTYGILVLFLAVILSIIAFIIWDESQPSIYRDITIFSDPHGKYVVNSDGDYWLTYYTDQNKCYEKSPPCLPDWQKTGNASITESPVDLEQFRDQEVIVDADFRPIQNSLTGDQRRLCIAGTCAPAKGTSTWYMSPLIIKSIRLAH